MNCVAKCALHFRLGENCFFVFQSFIMSATSRKDSLMAVASQMGILRNSKIIFFISQQKHMLSPLIRTVPVMGRNICFKLSDVENYP